MNEMKTRLMILRKNLDQLYLALNSRFETDFKEYDSLTNTVGGVRIAALGEISSCLKDIEFNVKRIDDCVSLAEDMEPGLQKKEQEVKV